MKFKRTGKHSHTSYEANNMGGYYIFITLQSLVNFSRATLPRAARTRLFGLIDTQKYAKLGTAVPPLPAHRSFAAPLFILW
jgi:hypothetical protein